MAANPRENSHERGGEQKDRLFRGRPDRSFWLGYLLGFLFFCLFFVGLGPDRLTHFDPDASWVDWIPLRDDVLLPLAGLATVVLLPIFFALAGGVLLHATLGQGREEPRWSGRIVRRLRRILGMSVLCALPLIPLSAPFVLFIPLTALVVFLKKRWRPAAGRALSLIYYLVASLIALTLHIYGGIFSTAEGVAILAGSLALFVALRLLPRPATVVIALVVLSSASVAFPPIDLPPEGRIGWGLVGLLALALPCLLLGSHFLRLAPARSYALYAAFALYLLRCFIFGAGMADPRSLTSSRFVRQTCDGRIPHLDSRFLHDGCTVEEGILFGTRIRRAGLVGCPPDRRFCSGRITAGDNFVTDCERDLGYTPDYMKRELVAIHLSDLSVARRYPFPQLPPPIFVSLGSGGTILYWLDEDGGFHSLEPLGDGKARDLATLSGAAGPESFHVDEQAQTALFADGDVMKLVDLRSGTIVRSLDFREPTLWPKARTSSLAFDAGSGKLYVTSFYSEWIYVFDPAKWEMTRGARVGTGIRRCTLDSRRQVLLASNYASGWMYAVSLPDLDVRAKVFIGKRGRMPYYSAMRDQVLVTSALGALEVDPRAWEEP